MLVRDYERNFADLQRVVAGRYVLQRCVRRGGMGVVYQAREPRLDRDVALKLLPPERAGDPGARERFLREAKIAARLSHPHIVPIFAVDEVDDFVFFVMSYVDGETLGDRIRARGRLDPAEATRVLREVAQALGHAHARGVVHRDVKPDNILLEAGTGRALVADFGIARAGNHAANTGPNKVVGTAEFMSPEQVCGEPTLPASDVYSLGVVGFYAVSGRLPITGTDDWEVLARHVSAPAPSLATVAPWAPRHLVETIDRCLVKDPLERFPDGHALAEALAARPSASYQPPPLAIRAFLAESRQLTAPTIAYAAFFSLGVAALVGEGSRPASLVAFGIAFLLLPLPIAFRRVRRLLAAGHGVRDLVGAIESEIRRRREELAFVYGAGPRRFERILREAVFGALAAGTAAVAAGHWWAAAPEWIWVAAAGSAAAALLGAIVARARAELRDDPRLGRRLRFWGGPLGRLLFRLGALGRVLPGVTERLEPTPSLD